MSAATADNAFDRALAFLLVDAGRKLSEAYDQSMKPLGLTQSQWRVMAYVSRTPGISQTELANSLECSRMAITSLLERMQDKALIERQAVEGDRRVRAVFLSRKGRALVKEMNRTAIGMLDRIFADLSMHDRKKLHKLLGVIKFNATTLPDSSGSLSDADWA